MRFAVPREVLLKPLQQVIGVVEKRQTMPILANILIQVKAGEVLLTTSDMEVEMQGRMAAPNSEDGEITVPGRKFFDIVRALPDGTQIDMKLAKEKVTLSAGRSRYTLATLSAADFPPVDTGEIQHRSTVAGAALKELIDRTGFAMAVQDVRYYLNGLLLELRGSNLRAVATDGHRLALCDSSVDPGTTAERQVIVPRKGVLELAKLIGGGEEAVELEFSRNHLRARVGNAVMTTKLIDGRFPDYDAVIPIGADKTSLLSKEELKSALQRAAILSNEKYRGVRVEMNPGVLKLVATNAEQDEAVEEIAAECTVSNLGIGFNVNYLLDAVNALEGSEVLLCLRDSGSSGLVRGKDNARIRHVVMPLRL
jgi:DNA polymerase III subunit beta